ncbi:hypothetical protein EMCRGX_G031779 [Ephydatia muelleri]
MASALARLFGGGKGKEDQPSPQVAIQKLRETEEMLGKISEFLEKEIAKELAAAKQACMKNKRAAMNALKRKKRLEKQLQQIDGTLSTIEFQREALENAQINTQVLKNMSFAAKALKAAHQHFITESFTAEQREYLERRFTQLTAAMVRPTTTDQVLASGVLLTAQLMAITSSTSSSPFPLTFPGIEGSSSELGRLIDRACDTRGTSTSSSSTLSRSAPESIASVILNPLPLRRRRSVSTIGSASADDRPVTAGFRAGEYGTDPRRGYGTRGVGWLPSPWRHAWASDAADSANRSILKHFGRRPPVSDILVWAECFTAMAAVLSRKYLQKAPELFAYAHRIFHAARNYDCHAWVTYDRVYRRQAATRCSLNWSVEDQSLYNEAFAGRAKQSTRCSSAWARTIRLRHARRCLWCSYLYRWGRLRPYGKPSVTKFEDDLWDCLRTSWNLISLSVYFRTS